MGVMLWLMMLPVSRVGADVTRVPLPVLLKVDWDILKAVDELETAMLVNELYVLLPDEVVASSIC